MWNAPHRLAPMIFFETWPGRKASALLTMKNPLFRSLLLPLLVGCFLAFTGSLHAAPVDLLRQAYVTLAQADHDYKGHRIAAMKQIEAAGKVLGVSLRGDGKNREKQGISDENLRAARSLLRDAASGLGGKALKHVRAAEKQINTALAIK